MSNTMWFVFGVGIGMGLMCLLLFWIINGRYEAANRQHDQLLSLWQERNKHAGLGAASLNSIAVALECHVLELPRFPKSSWTPDALGEVVRKVWVNWAREQPKPKPTWLVPWETLPESDREVDRRIGMRLFALGHAAGIGHR